MWFSFEKWFDVDRITSQFTKTDTNRVHADCKNVHKFHDERKKSTDYVDVTDDC